MAFVAIGVTSHFASRESSAQNPSRRETMKYGEHLKANIAPEYGPEPYLNYDLLDDIIRELTEYAPSR